MKKAFVTFLALLGFATVAPGQPTNGSVTLVNDNKHLVYLTPDIIRLNLGDIPLAGQPVPVTPLSGGTTLTVGLYAGRSPSELNLYGTDNIAPVPGRFFVGSPIHLDNPPMGYGGLAYFQYKVWESVFSSFEAQTATGVPHYGGESLEFTMNLQESNIDAPSNPINTGPNSFSTWAVGTFDLSAYSGAGALGAIEVGLIIPEPASWAILGGGFLLVAFLAVRHRTRAGRGSSNEYPNNSMSSA